MLDDKKIKELCDEMASNDTVRVNNAARQIVNSVSDRDLRTEFTMFVTDYQSAKESVAMHATFEALIDHVKKQYAMLYAQGFVMGCGYQQNNIKIALEKAVADQQIKIEQESKVEDKDVEFDSDGTTNL